MKVIAVGNHLAGRSITPYAGIFVDRQLDSLRAAGIDIEYFDAGPSLSPPALWKAVRQLRRRVRDVRPDLVHAQYGAGVGLVAVLSGAPAVVTFCGTDLHRGGGSMSVLRKLAGSAISNFAALRARRVICVSSVLLPHLRFKRRSANVIPRGVDLRLFSPGSRDDARRRLGWDLDTPVVLFGGGRDPVNKGLALAVETVERVRASIPNVRMEVPRNVDASEMPEYYRAADILLFTSLREGSPNVVKEAIACALPVVSVEVGDVAERLQGVTPSRVVARDANALAAAVVEILRTRGRSNGPEVAAAISLEATARSIIEVYEAVLQT